MNPVDTHNQTRRRSARRPQSPRRERAQGAPHDSRDRERERETLVRYADSGDPALLDELARDFLPLAKRLASRYAGGREPYDDLLQVASVGLVQAIQRFDPSRGTSFSSFAVPTILGELRRHFRDRGWSLRVPRELQERHLEVERALSDLPTELGRSPSIAEVAERVGLNEEQVLEAMEAGEAHHASSMDARMFDGDGEGFAVGDLVGGPDPGYDVVEHGAAIAPALKSLSETERRVLHLRFVEDLTQSQIGERVGVSQMQISRILRASLQRLRELSE